MSSDQHNSSTPAIQVQWSLDSTSNSLLSISKGLIRAATSDNVQVIALLACERFGNTIAMSRETCLKMERYVIPTPAPAPVRFLGALVGYAAGDCVTHFGTTQAGIQFLGLASAMMTMGTFKAAEALHGMLTSSAMDKTLLPTTTHLKYLLESLEPRCQLSHFASSVIGWEIFILQNLRASASSSLNPLFFHSERPTTKGVENLVDALRQISRIGDANVAKVTIKASRCIPWVIAFTKWCLGIPPSVFTEDGKTILEQPDARVIIVAVADGIGPGVFEIIIQHRIPNLPDLLDHLDTPGGSMWAGMINIQAYGEWLLSRVNADSESNASPSRAIRNALPYAVKQVIDRVEFHSYDESVDQSAIQKKDTSSTSTTVPEEFSHLRLTPLPDEESISKVVSYILHQDYKKLPVLGAGLRVHDLPLVKIHLEMLEERYLSSRDPEETVSDYRVDEDFIRDLANLTADVLAFSLFCFPEGLLVSLARFRTRESSFVIAIQRILRSGKSTPCAVSRLLLRALELVGHDIGEASNSSWVLSSFKGQAVYPAIFEGYNIQRNQYLALTWFPGRLMYQGDTYSLALARSDVVDIHGLDSPVDKTPVTRPCNLFPTYSVIWNLEKFDSYLTVSLGLSSKTGQLAPLSYAPSEVFESLSKSLLLESCPHDSNAALKAVDRFCTFIGPALSPQFETPSIPADNVEIVAVDGVDDLRFFALCRTTYEPAMTRPAVIRKRACLKCSLDLCRKAQINLLIL